MPTSGDLRMNAASDSPVPLNWSKSSRETTTATERPCTVMSCGPSRAASRTNSENRAFAACNCRPAATCRTPRIRENGNGYA